MKKELEKINFIGIGSAKSGSSWISGCLAEHPQVNMSKDKSLFFFNADYGNEYIKDNWTTWDKGVEWYISRFPTVEKGKIRGEFGVSYLHDPEAPKRIKQFFPDTKILVTLRNPPDMLYSLYWYNVNTIEANVPKTFEEAVEQKWCVDRGNYFKYLSKYFELFPKDNIHVMIFDDIKRNPEKLVKELYTFLGIDPEFKPSVIDQKVYSSIGHRFGILKYIGAQFFTFLRILKLEKMRRFLLDNPIFYSIYARINVVSKKYPNMSQETREKLNEFYKQDVKKLEQLIGKDLSFWLNGL